MSKIATWNVNSIKARLPALTRWLKAAEPDVVLLQETKVQDEAFPAEAIEDLGYNIASKGQRSYNGVAILAKSPIDVLLTALPGDPDDDQARYLEGFVGGIRVATIYLPNGNPIESEKFSYKLAWLDRLRQHVEDALGCEDAFVLGGDYNVIPDDRDVWDPEMFRDDALARPESRAGFRRLLHLGLTDALRAVHGETPGYTYWDYQGRAFAADHGLRIDHLLLTPQVADRLKDAGVDRTPRGWDKPSDHAPVWCTLDNGTTAQGV
ncbi:MAG: exodeoxyribonuclease III [Rhodospirillales bacterium]|nr:MAG: exodeoxyribonuclease III [Rhodospirillales bacterium]